MTSHEHRAIVEAERAGTLVIGIDRTVARRFFSGLSHARIQQAIGEPVFVERAVVTSSMVLAFVALLAALVAAVWAFHLWAIVIVPLTLVVFWQSLMSASRADSRAWPAALLLAGAVGLTLTHTVGTPAGLWASAAMASVFLIRATYSSATALLRALVLRNHLAFELLQGNGLVVREV